MTTTDLFRIVNADLDSRNLKNPNIRKNALRKILSFIESSNSYLFKKQINLPCKRDFFESEYRQYKKNVELSGAEKHVIKLIYDYAKSIKGNDLETDDSIHNDCKAKDAFSGMECDISKIESDLISGIFHAVDDLANTQIIPDKPGLYCIKLRKDVILPKIYDKIDKDVVIYIGKASHSLLRRLWEQELNHKKPATFFRSIGSILGYIPPKGSLSKDSNNYKFNESDTDAIRKWMKQSLLVRFIILDNSNLADIEKILIKKYTPVINIQNNPFPNEQLMSVRAKCISVARGY